MAIDIFENLKRLHQLGLGGAGPAAGGSATPGVAAPYPAPAAAPAPVANPILPRGYEFGKRLAEFAKGQSGGLLGKAARGLGRVVPGFALVGQGMADFGEEGKETVSALRTGVGAASVFSPQALALGSGMLTGDLLASGVGALAERNEPKNPMLSPNFNLEVQRAGGVEGYVKGIQDKEDSRLAAQDAAAQKVAEARSARVAEVIAQSQAGRTEDAQAAQVAQAQSQAQTVRDDVAERRSMIESAIARLPNPGLASGATTGDALTEFFRRKAINAVARPQLKRLAEREFTAGENAITRATSSEEAEKGRVFTRSENEKNRIIDREKILATLAGRERDSVTIANVKQGLTEIPVLVNKRTGEALGKITSDDQGNVTVGPVRKQPTTAEIHAAALKQINESANPRLERARINEELKRRGLPLLP